MARQNGVSMTTTQNNRTRTYTKELVCMNCGDIRTHTIPFGVEWHKHVTVCESCGCSSFSDYYKNIDNFRPAPKFDFSQGPWMSGTPGDWNTLDCRGVDVSPSQYDPMRQIRTYFDTTEGQDQFNTMVDNRLEWHKTHLTDQEKLDQLARMTDHLTLERLDKTTPKNY